MHKRSVKILIGIVMLSLAGVIVWYLYIREDLSKYGYFPGAVKAEWQEQTSSMKLLEDFSYFDPSGKEWKVPKGSTTDGASIPRVFWSIVGDPFGSGYRNAAVVHDYLCEKKDEPWQDVHRLFYYANRAAGVEELKSKILYGAVRIGGPKWGSGPSNCYSSCHSSPDTYKLDSLGQLFNSPMVEEDVAESLVLWIESTNRDVKNQIDQYIRQKYPHSTFGHQ